MRDKHIKSMLGDKSVGKLSDAETLAIEDHASECRDCMRAYKAALLSDALIRARASESIEPDAFFTTRLMAVARDRELSMEVPPLLRLWKAAGALVSSMAVLVLILFGLAVFGIGNQTPDDRFELATAPQSLYSPEYVMLGESDVTDIPYDQVLSTIYGEETDGQQH